MADKTFSASADLAEVARIHAERHGCPTWEVYMLEPGWWALAWYRVANWLYRHRRYFLARWVSQHGRRTTGIELHPGAKIGRRCLFLPGPGATIGETAVVGDDARFEAGACLLGSGQGAAELLGRGQAAVARDLVEALGPSISTARTHPTLGVRVTLEARAMVIGDVFLGNDVRVLAGAVVTRDIPDRGIAVGVPGRILPQAQARPDPDARAIKELAERLYEVEERVQVVAFHAKGQLGGTFDRWKTENPAGYGPIGAVEALIDGAGI